MRLPYISEMSPVRPPNLPYIDEMRAADKLLRPTPAFNVLFLRRSMYFSSYASTFNHLKHRCESNSPMFAPSTAYAKPIARTQSKPLTSVVWRTLAHIAVHTSIGREETWNRVIAFCRPSWRRAQTDNAKLVSCCLFA